MNDNSTEENEQTMKDISHRRNDNAVVQALFVRGENTE